MRLRRLGEDLISEGSFCHKRKGKEMVRKKIKLEPSVSQVPSSAWGMFFSFLLQ